MEQWELAARRYKQIVPEPIVSSSDFPRARVRSWLESDVRAAVEEFVPRARFQEYASWPIRVFADNSGSDERRQVKQLAEQMGNLASSLKKLTSIDSVRESLQNRYPPANIITSQKVRIGADAAHAIDRKVEVFDEWELVCQRLESLAHGISEPYVNVNDYFSPLPETVETATGETIQRADTIVSINPRFHPVGEFIVRAMFERTQPNVDLLLRLSGHSLAASFRRTAKRQELAEEIQQSRDELESNWNDLRVKLLTGPEFRKRNSCAILTQIYAAYHPQQNLLWLDLPDEVLQRGREVIRGRLEGFRNAEMADRIAAALNDLGSLYGADEDPQQMAFEKAITQKRLVILEDAQHFYFDQGGPLRLSGRSWECFLALAKAARAMSYTEVSDVYGDRDVGPSTFPTAIERLQAKLPQSMIDLIAPGGTKGGYQLNLQRDDIAIF